MDRFNIVSENKESPREEISIRALILGFQEWIRMLVKYWLLLLLVLFTGAIIGYLYAASKKPIYKAELNFVLEDDKSGGGGAAAGLASQFGLDLGGGSGTGAFSAENLIELLKSRSMVQKALLTTVRLQGQNKTLADEYMAINKFDAAYQKQPDIRGINFRSSSPTSVLTIKQDSLLAGYFKSILKENLVIDKADKKSSLISVQFTSTDQIFAKIFTETLVKNVSEFYIQTKTKKESDNVNILQIQVDSVRRQLNLAISGVARSQELNADPNPALQTLRTGYQRRQFDVQTNSAILTELIKNLELSKLTLRKETPLIQIIDYPILPLDKTTLSKSKSAVIGGLVTLLLAISIISAGKIYRNVMIPE